MTIDTKTLRSEAQDYFNAGLYRAGGTLVRAADTIDSLTRRLEITDDAPGWDGIACRDETIRSQERVIDDMRVRMTKLREALQYALMALEDYLPAHRNAVTDAAIESTRRIISGEINAERP